MYDVYCQGWPGRPKNIVKILNTEHNKKVRCYCGIASVYFKYYQRVVFRVKVLFLSPAVQYCTYLTCLLVSRGCCCVLSAAVTIVLTDLSGSKFIPSNCHTLSTHLMDPLKVGCLTTYFPADISLLIKNHITIRISCLNHSSSRVAMFN